MAPRAFRRAYAVVAVGYCLDGLALLAAIGVLHANHAGSVSNQSTAVLLIALLGLTAPSSILAGLTLRQIRQMKRFLREADVLEEPAGVIVRYRGTPIVRVGGADGIRMIRKTVRWFPFGEVEVMVPSSGRLADLNWLQSSREFPRHWLEDLAAGMDQPLALPINGGD